MIRQDDIVRYVLEHPGRTRFDVAKHLDPAAYGAGEGDRSVSLAIIAGLIEVRPGTGRIGPGGSEQLFTATFAFAATCRADGYRGQDWTVCHATATAGCACCEMRYCADHCMTVAPGRVECLVCDSLTRRQPSWTR